MTGATSKKLSLIPVSPASGRHRVSQRGAPSQRGAHHRGPSSQTLEGPLSEMRVSPRALADRTVHQSVGAGTRLKRESLLNGDWTIVDAHREGPELRALLRVGGAMVSAREFEILRSILAGEPDRDVARRMGITRQCVCGHLSNGLYKLGTESRFVALQVWRILAEIEKGRTGRALLAEVAVEEQLLVSLRFEVPPRPELEVRLSSAETHVAWLVCDGLSNREIAFERGTAERTVANQVASIFNKLEVCRRFDVAQFLLGLL